MTDLAALMEAVRTQEPTRELADRVLLAFGWYRAVHTEYRGDPDWQRPDKQWIGCREADRPNPLTSIDDALAFLPEGYHWSVCSEDTSTDGTRLRPVASVWRPSQQPLETEGQFAETPAAALCIAALAVLKAQEQER